MSNSPSYFPKHISIDDINLDIKSNYNATRCKPGDKRAITYADTIQIKPQGNVGKKKFNRSARYIHTADIKKHQSDQDDNTVTNDFPVLSPMRKPIDDNTTNRYSYSSALKKGVEYHAKSIKEEKKQTENKKRVPMPIHKRLVEDIAANDIIFFQNSNRREWADYTDDSDDDGFLANESEEELPNELYDD